MGFLTRDAILSADDLPRTQVDVPEWGGVVMVRTLNGIERDAWEMATAKAPDTDTNIRARLVALATCDEAGNRLFTAEDVAALGTKSTKALERVFDAALDLAKARPIDTKAAAKNS